jgi:hypothetical protein
VLEPSVKAAMVRLRIHFLGRWLRHGGLYPIWLLRIWRQGAARCESRWMDEHMILPSGQIAPLSADLIHQNENDLDRWVSKHVGYATREARDLAGSSASHDLPNGQAGRKRWFKKTIYSRTPLFFRAWAFWIYRYFLRLGFLDGPQGFVYHFLQCLWYRSLVDAKLFEYRRVQRSTKHTEWQSDLLKS